MTYHRDAGCPEYWLYDGLRIQAEVETHRFVVSYARAHASSGSRVLDLAAGQGALSKQLADAGFQVSCTSWNGKCQVPIPTYELNLDLPFSLADVGGAPFPLVCAIEIIEHLENPTGFLRHCHGLVASGGTLILSTPNVESAAARLQWLVRGCPRIFDVGEVQTNRHISMMWRQGLEHLIELAGFRIVERHFLSTVPLRRTLRTVVKQLIYRAMEYALPGDTRGSTRLYVLAPSTAPKTAGPEQVY